MLPECFHRGDSMGVGRWACNHPGLMPQAGVTAEFCTRKCEPLGIYCNREPAIHHIRTAPSEPAKPETFDCVYRGAKLRGGECDLCGIRGQPFEVYKCEKFGECSVTRKHSKVKACSGCEGRATERPVELQPLPLPRGFRDKPSPANVVDARGQNADVLRGSMRGASVFLMCGGPSLVTMPLDLFRQPGILTAAVNNAAVVFRPNIWFAVDGADRFHESIHRDPAVMKFQRRSCAAGAFRTRRDGKWVSTGIQTRWMPNTWFYEHSKHFDATEFLTATRPAWGIKGQNTCSVMLVALRLLYWLGVSRIFILGADFTMTPDKTYAFDEPKAAGACASNNRLYATLNKLFAELQPHFLKAGLEVFNSTPGGNLNAFPRVPFGSAVEAALHHFPDEVRTRGLYAGSDPKKRQVD